MNKTNRTILISVLSALGLYAVYKYTPLPKWVRKNIFKDDVNEIDGKITKEDNFPLAIGSKKAPEVGVVQLSLGTPLTGILNIDDITFLNMKLGENLQSVSENDYAIFFKKNEDAFKKQLDEFYKDFNVLGI